MNYPTPSNSRTSSTTPPLEIGPENSINYPPLELTNLIDYPPLEIGPENSIHYPPPSNSRTSSTTPPLEIDLDPPNF